MISRRAFLASAFFGLQARLRQVAVGQNLVGWHDWSPEPAKLVAEMGETAWCVTTHALSEDWGGHYYDDWGGRISFIARLNWGYGSTGTIPPNDWRADEFADRCRIFAAQTPHVRHFVIGNETNHPNEWPDGEPISPTCYGQIFRRCRHAIKQVRPDAIVMPAPVAPWLRCCGLDAGPYWRLLLWECGPVDALALHIYTHSASPNSIYSEEPANDGTYWNWLIYRSLLMYVPNGYRHLQIFCTEACPQPTWLPSTAGAWMQAAAGDIDWWNQRRGTQKIRALCFYRWADRDNKVMSTDDEIVDGLMSTIARGYRG